MNTSIVKYFSILSANFSNSIAKPVVIVTIIVHTITQMLFVREKLDSEVCDGIYEYLPNDL